MISLASKTHKSLTKRPDAWSGLFFIALGGGAFVYSMLNYRLGVPAKMGPGFFPALVGGVIGVLGLVILLLDLRTALREAPAPDGEASTFGWGQIASILAAILAFGLLIKPLGMIVGLIAMILISRLARRGTWLELGVLSAILCTIAYVIFVVGLKMPFKVVPW